MWFDLFLFCLDIFSLLMQDKLLEERTVLCNFASLSSYYKSFLSNVVKLSNVISHNVVKKCTSSNNKMWMRANQCMLLILQINRNPFDASSFFLGGGGVRFWCLVSRNFWLSLMLLHKRFWWNKTVSSCCNMLLRQIIIVLLVFFPVLRLSSYSIVLNVHKDCVSQRNLNSTFSYFHVDVFVYLPTLLSWLV